MRQCAHVSWTKRLISAAKKRMFAVANYLKSWNETMCPRFFGVCPCAEWAHCLMLSHASFRTLPCRNCPWIQWAQRLICSLRTSKTLCPVCPRATRAQRLICSLRKHETLCPVQFYQQRATRFAAGRKLWIRSKKFSGWRLCACHSMPDVVTRAISSRP